MIDAHQHFWQLSQPFRYEWLQAPQLAKINRDYMPDDLLPHLRAVGVSRSIFVQTQHDCAENRWVLELAERYDFIAGVVGWVDLASEHCEEQILEFKSHPKFLGVRHVVQDEPDENFIVRPEIMRGLRLLEKHGLPYDLLFYVKHLRHAAVLAKELPNLRMVIDHLAKPRIKDRAFDDWTENLRAAAAFPNVYCKLSGLITEADWNAWKPEDLRPYVEIALEAFSPARCMYGSDWPVCELAGSYSAAFNALVEALGPIGSSEAAAIFGGTAREFYRLE